MKMQSCTWNGTNATVYHMDVGDKIPFHAHPIEHTTMVLVGSTKVTVASSGTMTMKEGDFRTLPAEFDHEIDALQDGTVVLNMMAAAPNSAKPGAKADDGGVAIREIT